MKKKKISIIEILFIALSYGIATFIASYINFRLQGDSYSVLKLAVVTFGCFFADFVLILVIYKLRKALKK